MKRSIVIGFISLFYILCNAQNACQNAYMEALQEYNKKNYTEAQRKLVIVAQTCGDYSDVWKKLKECNKKLADLQTQQANKISHLEGDLVAEKKKSENYNEQLEQLKIAKKDLEQSKDRALGVIKALQETKAKDDSIKQQALKDTIKLKNALIDQLQQANKELTDKPNKPKFIYKDSKKKDNRSVAAESDTPDTQNESSKPEKTDKDNQTVPSQPAVSPTDNDSNETNQKNKQKEPKK